MSPLHLQTRRHFFSRCTMGIGQLALASLLSGGRLAASASSSSSNPLAPKPVHFPAKAKSVIFLFMAGGPSQHELFDYKPRLVELHGQPTPPSLLEGKRFAFMSTRTQSKILGHDRVFRRHGQSGAWVSDLMPHLAGVVDDLCFLKTCRTDLFNHAPAKLFMNTGTGAFGRPSMGAWLTYGLGSECDNLPGFVVLQSGPRGPRGGSSLWTAGLLPSTYQGVPFRSQGDPILNLSTPRVVTAEQQRSLVDTTRALNLKRLAATGDDEISARINSYEMAFRMQASAPELMDTTGESRATLDLYGIEDPKESSFARNCLLARRLVERGVRFVQLYDTSWDHHGNPTESLTTHLPLKARDVDRASAGLIRDLKARGLLDETIVIWGGEFGRTPMGEDREHTGRNHHIDAFTMWFAGGGFKPGISYGVTDELGFGPAENSVHVRDIHATILHLLGIDHERLSIRSQGLDIRLTGVEPAHVIKPIIA